MKTSTVAVSCLVFLATSMAGAQAETVAVSPIQKVLEMLSSLATKVTMEGKAAGKTNEETQAWCKDMLANLGFDIKTGKKEISELQATIASETASIAASQTKIEEVAAQVTEDEADLAAATKVRATESEDFKAEEKELDETIATLERAIGVLKKEMSKGGSALVQVEKIGNNVAQALSTLVDAALLNSNDAAKLTAFVQSTQQEDDEETAAPAGAVYESHSGGIVETLEGLYEKATSSLTDLQKKETSSQYNFEMLEQSLTDSIKYAGEDMASTKKALAASEAAKAAAEGDLAQATTTLKTDETGLATTSAECTEKAETYAAEKQSRGEELAALAEAQKVLMEATGGAAAQSYSFLQTTATRGTRSATVTNRGDLVNYEAVRFVRDLAKKFNNDQGLMQLSMRMSGAMRASSHSADPFAKVTGLIRDMIEKLQDEAQADASHKAFCDKELGESATREDQLNAKIDTLKTKIDKMSAASAQLKSEVAALQKSLSDLAKSSAEMTDIRMTEKADFAKAKAELTEGIEGVAAALKVLREYYAKDAAHEAASEAGTGIITLLEVVESDFTKGLSQATVEEQASAEAYDKQTKGDAILKATMEADVKYKTKESTGLDQEVSSLSSDMAGAQSELSSVVEYISKLNAGCISMPATYSERASRRQSMIAGLKEALEILSGVSLMQKKSMLRGTRLHLALN
mmetsp:Transcript_101582/g.180121  ORF Transcript_101582/g.180121 Transcript_101582/m.180121 type:complete len:693 (-) Transcript_101582:90-2168(-)